MQVPIDSFVSVETADKYHIGTSQVLWNSFKDEVKEQRLVQSSRLIKRSFSFKNGINFDSANDVPDALVAAVCEVAVSKTILAGEKEVFKRTKVSSIEREMMDGSKTAYQIAMDEIASILGDLVIIKKARIPIPIMVGGARGL